MMLIGRVIVNLINMIMQWSSLSWSKFYEIVLTLPLEIVFPYIVYQSTLEIQIVWFGWPWYVGYILEQVFLWLWHISLWDFQLTNYSFHVVL